MGAIANFVINDNAAVARTYTPEKNEGGIAGWVDRTVTTLSSAFRRWSAKLDPERPGRLTNYVTITYDHPYEMTVNGVNVIQAVAHAVTKFTVPSGLTFTQRNQFWTLYLNGLQAAVMQAYVKDLDAPYG
jgi:hypothetical protein